MKRLYEMNLGDCIKISYWSVTRVPGGWIWDYGNGDSATSVFVPFDNEFQEENQSHDK